MCGFEPPVEGRGLTAKLVLVHVEVSFNRVQRLIVDMHMFVVAITRNDSDNKLISLEEDLHNV
jgi:hypothetical protein